MPEYPDITVYIEALERRLAGQVLREAVLRNPFLLRSVEPPLEAFPGHRVQSLRRIGKRIAIGFDDALWMVLHLMIAGRLHWRDSGAKKAAKGSALLILRFDNGELSLSEAGAKRRASLVLARGDDALRTLDPGGLEVMDCDLAQFTARLQRENHTLKRALADPRILSGIGNAYSDEILHRACLSPFAMTQKLAAEELERLFGALRATLAEWTAMLRSESGDRFPEKVTAFRPGMAVHGRYRMPCPVCGTAVQRIRYASNETNYCPRCQTGGTIYADRALSRLLKQDWPRSVEDLERER
jgi:formamidopyrimidine-DNA glycosylase